MALDGRRRSGSPPPATSTAPSRCASGSRARSPTLRGQADLVLLAGDLTTHGEPEEAAVLADACRALELPVFAVLGNHDHPREPLRRGRSPCSRTPASGVLQRDFAVLEVGGARARDRRRARASSAASPARSCPTSASRCCARSTPRRRARSTRSRRGSRQIAGCHRRIVLLHYAPIPETLVGEPETIWAFLGSSRLAAPIGAHRPDLVLHGHAHRGSFAGELGAVPVRNVAVHVIGQATSSSSSSEAGQVSSSVARRRATCS